MNIEQLDCGLILPELCCIWPLTGINIFSHRSASARCCVCFELSEFHERTLLAGLVEVQALMRFKNQYPMPLQACDARRRSDCSRALQKMADEGLGFRV